MSKNRDNFIKWFKEPLKTLYSDEHAGFPILMVSLPLLERYLRQSSGAFEKTSLAGTTFYDALLQMFPSLGDKTTAERFWEVYRHGLLHQATLKSKAGLIEVSVHNQGWPAISVSTTADGTRFSVSPVEFSKKVIEEIEAHFSTFEAPDSPHHLPGTISPKSGASGYTKNES